jgi:hypothetical protein
MPGTSEIFDQLFKDYPSTWKVQRNVSNRFIVKRRFAVTVEANGVDPTKSQSSSYYGPGPCNQCKTLNKFIKRLGCATEWKNNSTGDVGDIKEGALYFIVAPSMGTKINVYGKFRLYFKSVGNQ